MPQDVKVIAIMAAYNEADVIGQVVRHLVTQGVNVHLLDDGSTDGTLDAVRAFVEEGLVTVEPFCSHDERGLFTWERILARKEVLAQELDADWFIHHDADECRDSPWPKTTLREAIQIVDGLGYNAIDFEVFNFCPIDDSFQAGADLCESFRYCEPAAPHDRRQIKCWRKQAQHVDLRTLGGHEAIFDHRRVYPVRFILRHYPIRSQQHGDQKVFRERRDRFVDTERERGWHVQYDDFEEGASFIRDRSALAFYDVNRARLQVTLYHREMEARLAEGEAFRSELEEQRRQREQLERDLETERVQRAHLERHLATQHDELDALRARSEELSRAQEALDRQHKAATLDLRGAEAALGERIAANAALQAELLAFQSAAAARDRNARNVAQMLRVAENRISALESSKSWRWTEPLRKAHSLLRHRRRSLGR